MTDNLDILRPEVRDAFLYLDRFENCPSGWTTIRAELLRLAVRNAELEAKATRDHDWVSDLLSENKKAEAELAALRELHKAVCESAAMNTKELAALKARIADAPTATLMLISDAGDLTLVWAENPDDWAGKTVRLVVEE